LEHTLKIKRVPIESLHLDPANARVHPDENLDAIEGSLRRFGQAEPLVVQAKTGRVVGGNGRLAVMKKLGWTECDVVELDIDDLTATGLGIALNRSAETASWDEETLGRLLRELQTEDALSGVGFTDDEVEDLLARFSRNRMRCEPGDWRRGRPPLDFARARLVAPTRGKKRSHRSVVRSTVAASPSCTPATTTSMLQAPR